MVSSSPLALTPSCLLPPPLQCMLFAWPALQVPSIPLIHCPASSGLHISLAPRPQLILNGRQVRQQNSDRKLTSSLPRAAVNRGPKDETGRVIRWRSTRKYGRCTDCFALRRTVPTLLPPPPTDVAAPVCECRPAKRATSQWSFDG